jgi:hypothetical protein
MRFKFFPKIEHCISVFFAFNLIFIFVQNSSLSRAQFFRNETDELVKKVSIQCHDVIRINQSSQIQTEPPSGISDEEICQALTKFIVDPYKSAPSYFYDGQISQIIFVKRGTQLKGLRKDVKNSVYFLGSTPRETDMRPLVFYILRGHYRALRRPPEDTDGEKWRLGRYNYSTGVLNVKTGEPVGGATGASIKHLCGVLLDCSNMSDDVPQFRSLLKASDQEIRQYLVSFHKIVSLDKQRPPQVIFMRRVRAEEIPNLDRTYDMVKQQRNRKHLLFAVLKGSFRVLNVPDVNPEQWLAGRFNYTSVVLDLKTGELIAGETTETKEPFCGALGCLKGSKPNMPVNGLW